MKILRPLLVDDDALLYSSIPDGSGVEELSGEPSGELELSGMSGELELSGDMASAGEWDAATLYALDETVVVTAANYHHGFQSLSGGTSHVVTISHASPGVVTWAGHALPANTPVTFTTTGTLPTGLSVGTVYYVRNPATDTFEVSATSGGASINTTTDGAGTHTAVANPNLNKAPLEHPEFWLDTRATNRWRMFDQLNGSQSTAANRIEVRIQTTGRIDAIALLNISGATVQVISETEADGEIYNQTRSLISTTGITDWWSYFFEDIVRRNNLVLTGLPLFVGQTITVIIEDPGNTVAVGTLIVGKTKDIGVTVYGAGLGITDYSRKDVDLFGNYDVVERAFSNRGSFKVKVEENRVDEVQRLLASYRATPILYLGGGDFESTQIFGFYRNFDQDLEGPNEAWCTLELEGLI